MRAAPTGNAGRIAQRGQLRRAVPTPRQLERVDGDVVEGRALPPPPPVALTFRDLLAGGVEVSGEALREPDVRDELEGPGALTVTCRMLLISLAAP
jgi:hypothetical protein